MRADNQVLSLMVAAIYAARLNCYMSTLEAKTPDGWRKYRKRAIEASITEAVMICEAVERDFPTRSSDRREP